MENTSIILPHFSLVNITCEHNKIFDILKAFQKQCNLCTTFLIALLKNDRDRHSFGSFLLISHPKMLFLLLNVCMCPFSSVTDLYLGQLMPLCLSKSVLPHEPVKICCCRRLWLRIPN